MPNSLGRRPTHGHVVIIDDNEGVCQSLSLMLRARGYKIDTYGDGKSVLEDMDADKPTCFLIDYKLPHMTGIDLLQAMRARGMDAPAFMITGFYSPGLAQKAQDVGFGDVIEKPLPAAELLSKIEGLGTA